MIATLRLPRPISVNSLYANVPGKGRVKAQRYRTWQRNAMNEIMMQGPRPNFTGPVRVTLFIGEAGVSEKFDGDNAVKAYLDTLVKMGIIPDDSRSVVRSHSVHWVAGMEGADCRIEATGADALVDRMAAE